jgi:hypothetical protein
MPSSSTNPVSAIPQKRPRPVQSCLICRGKKLKCDRQQPCAQCVRNNRSGQCVYDERAGSLGNFLETPTSRSKSPRIEGGTSISDLSRPPTTILESSGDSISTATAVSTSESSRIAELQARVRRLEQFQHDDHSRFLQSGPDSVNDAHGLRNQHHIGHHVPGSGLKHQGLDKTRSLIDLVSFVSIFDTSLFTLYCFINPFLIKGSATDRAVDS